MRKVDRIINTLATLPAKFRFHWDKNSKVPKNARRNLRRYFNKLKMDETLMQAGRDFIVYGSVKEIECLNNQK